jgi:hypothetical protein
MINTSGDVDISGMIFNTTVTETSGFFPSTPATTILGNSELGTNTLTLNTVTNNLPNQFITVIDSHGASQQQALSPIPFNSNVNFPNVFIDVTTPIQILVQEILPPACDCVEYVNVEVTTGGNITYLDCSGGPQVQTVSVGPEVIGVATCIDKNTLGGTAVFTIDSYGPCCTVVTPTPTPDPTPPPRPPKALLFIEPYSAANSIGDYMYNLGHNFYGFSNGTQPSLVFSAFTDEMRSYVEFSGWTTGTLPRIVEVDVPQVDGGVDSFGNPVFKYNFVTNVISANTIGEQAWYTWIIPTGLTNNQIQTEIELSINNPNVFVTNKTEPTIYQNTFLYVGGHITPGVYRVYTTFPSLNFQLFDNQNIYFKGGTVE